MRLLEDVSSVLHREQWPAFCHENYIVQGHLLKCVKSMWWRTPAGELNPELGTSRLFFCYFGLMLQAVYIDFCCFLSSAQTGIEIERVALALFCLWSILTAQQVGLSFLFIPTMRTILCEGANLKVSEEKIYKRF